MSAPDGWWCNAYGPPPDGDQQAAEGAWPICFVTASGRRRCGSPGECAATMTAERQRVFRAINEHAAAGDDVMADLAEHFPAPGDLLGGRDRRDDAGGDR